jgi:hypothetical protein
MQVNLRQKSIEPVRSEEGLAITHVAFTQELGELELKIQTSSQADFNAAEQEARKTIEAFANSHCVAAQSSPFEKKMKHPG